MLFNIGYGTVTETWVGFWFTLQRVRPDAKWTASIPSFWWITTTLGTHQSWVWFVMVGIYGYGCISKINSLKWKFIYTSKPFHIRGVHKSHLLGFCWTSVLGSFSNKVRNLFCRVLSRRMIFFGLVERIVDSLSSCFLQCFPFVPPEVCKFQQSIFSSILIMTCKFTNQSCHLQKYHNWTRVQSIG